MGQVFPNKKTRRGTSGGLAALQYPGQAVTTGAIASGAIVDVDLNLMGARPGDAVSFSLDQVMPAGGAIYAYIAANDHVHIVYQCVLSGGPTWTPVAGHKVNVRVSR